MDYQDVLTRGAKVLWRQKALWPFGLLAALGGGMGYRHFRLPSFRHFAPTHGTVSPFPFGKGMLSPYNQPLAQPWPLMGQNHVPHVPHATAGLILAAVAVALVVLIGALIALAAHSLGMPAVVLGIQKDMETGGRPLSVGEVYAAAKPYFWRMVGFSVVWFVIFMVLFIFLMLPYSVLFIGANGRLLAVLLCLMPIVGIFFILIWLLSILLEVSLLALVLEGRKVFNALERGWQLYKAHFWKWVLAGLLLEAVRFVIGLLLLLPGLVFGIGSFAAIFASVLARDLSSTTRLTLGIGGLLALAVFIIFAWLISAALVIYTQGGWVSAYNQLVGQNFSEGEPAVSPAD